MNFKYIHIGRLIEQRVSETEIGLSRICSFLNCTEGEIKKMYTAKSLDTDIILRWSKLLEYDLFRIYSQHLILYGPPKSLKNDGKRKSELPQFRKSIYTKEVVDFILRLLSTGEKTKDEVMREYRIPKTTLYKWISKYKV